MHQFIALTNRPNAAKDCQTLVDLIRTFRTRVAAPADGASAERKDTAGTPDVLCVACYHVDETAAEVEASEAQSVYNDLVVRLETFVDEERDLTVIVHGADPEKLNPIRHEVMGGRRCVAWSVLISWLILTFPDIDWVFVPTVKQREKNGNGWIERYGFVRAFREDPPSLFDPWGLRNDIRENARNYSKACLEDADRNDLPPTSKSFLAPYLKLREGWVATLDEERAFCHLNAYMAYRFGYRAAALNSFGVAEAYLTTVKEGPTYTLEDRFLNFCDGPAGLSELNERNKKFPLLKKVKEHRVLVTGDDHNFPNGDGTEFKQNDFKTVLKPYGGIFRLKKEIELKVPDRNGGAAEVASLGLFARLASAFHNCRWGVEGYAFDWKGRIAAPTEGAGSGERMEVEGHSSPGALTLIASTLLQRARALLPNANSVSAGSKGAVFSNDAFELLGGRTPTLACYALRIRHEFEIIAECSFAGVEHALDMEMRLEEVQQEIRFVSAWLTQKRQMLSVLNLEMDTINRMTLRLREAGQFGEEQRCLVRTRQISSRLYVPSGKWSWMFWMFWMLCPVLPYINYLLKGFEQFILSLVLWVVLFTLLFGFSDPSPGFDPEVGLHHALSTFLLLGQPFGVGEADVNGLTRLQYWLTIWAILMGFFHLSLLIAHMYTIVARR